MNYKYNNNFSIINFKDTLWISNKLHYEKTTFYFKKHVVQSSYALNGLLDIANDFDWLLWIAILYSIAKFSLNPNITLTFLKNLENPIFKKEIVTKLLSY